MSVPESSDYQSLSSAELRRLKENTPASTNSKKRIHEQALRVAKTGLYYRGAITWPAKYEKESDVPETKDILRVVAEDEPSSVPGSEGLIMLIVHSEAVGSPDLIDDREIYSRTLTRYDFKEIPDGLHVDKMVTQFFKPTERPLTATSVTAEEWELARGAFIKSQKHDKETQALEREAGLNFFSEQDAEDLQALLNLTWPEHAAENLG